MKHKKSKFTLECEPQIVTAKQLAKERGLDPAILEKEADQFSFGTIGSGVMHVDKAKYDSWIASQIRESGIEKDKRVTYKSISESKKVGALKGIISNLNTQLKTDTNDLQYLQQEIPNMTKGLERKEGLIKMTRLSEKVAGKKRKIKAAEKRLNHLYDAELGFLDPPKEVEEVKDELGVDDTVGATAHILDE